MDKFQTLRSFVLFDPFNQFIVFVFILKSESLLFSLIVLKFKVTMHRFEFVKEKQVVYIGRVLVRPML